MQGESHQPKYLEHLSDSFRPVLFTLSDETDMDVISDAMESFIAEFKDELVPASAQIVERLVGSQFKHSYVIYLTKSPVSKLCAPRARARCECGRNFGS